ncbi:SIMPL domain-containing protein [Halorubrum sp. AD140]|uniref:SIMPL domain-containing protein n=1 Tax=Halorubrum sp. AD140 TaxID=3050073 RepID=UPI002ACCAF90|nr:SIMPL domain-containing protein [Halorubrum sp. AD140]MDZ5810395.1 SIMPL domain-containing protein [Halorubrum sp. AD140]
MNRTLATAIGVALLVALAGCAGLAGSTGDADVGANENAGDDPALDRSIDVTADGEAAAEPDRATVRVAVTATGDDSAAVRDELAAGDEELRAALTEWGIDEDDIRTDRYDVRESHETRDDPERTEYEGVHSYAVTIDDVDAVGEVIDVSVDAGADEVQRIEFGLTDEREQEVRETAIENAMSNADSDAAVLADSSGLEITGAYRVSTADTGVTPYRVSDAEMLAASGDDGDAATGVETGDVSVEVSVNVVYGAEEA